jgi:hypothetical protein
MGTAESPERPCSRPPRAVNVARMTELVVDVPFNTMLADLDSALDALLREALAEHGFGGVRVAFDAPTRDWSAGLSAPTLNLFMYDLREAASGSPREWIEHRENGQARRERPPLRIDCAYSITAWAQAVQDEHRMLSQVLAVLLAHERLPAEHLGRLAEDRKTITTRIGRPKAEGSAEFWSALGGQYKLALDYVVTLSCDPGVTFHRGPQVRTHTTRVADRNGADRAAELHRVAGVIRHEDGTPAAGAWLALPDAGAFATVGPDGRFAFPRVPAGRHRCECRTLDGTRATSEVTVPGPGIDLVIPGE